MRSLNSVHLDGIVVSCEIAGTVEGKTVAKLSVVTLHPKEQPVGSEASVQEYEKIRHNVRVVASSQFAGTIRSLAEGLEAEGRSGAHGMHPCVVEGVLREQDGENFIEARDGCFSLTETVRTKGNNLARIVGKIQSVSYTDRSANIVLDTPQGRVFSFFPRQVNASAWESVASGKIKKGDLISLQGPIMNMNFSDGKETMRTSMVVPHIIQKIRLNKAQGNGVSM